MNRSFSMERTFFVSLALFLLAGVVFLASSCRSVGPAAAFLGDIDRFGRTEGEMEETLGSPDIVTRDATGPFVTRFYYDGLEAVFDDYAGRISILSITDGRWTTDLPVSIGSTKDEVVRALGDGYVRLPQDGGRDVWVYLCPRPSSDTEAALCDNCRVCYISFEGGRVVMIEWSDELLGWY